MAEPHVQIDGSPTTSITTPHVPAFDPDTVLDVRIEIEADVGTNGTGSNRGLVALGATDDQSWRLRTQSSDGRVRYDWSSDGISYDKALATPDPIDEGTRVAYRVEHSCTTGQITFQKATRIDGDFTTIHTGSNPPGTPFPSSAALEVGKGPGISRFSGKVYAFEFRVNGSLVSSWNSGNLTTKFGRSFSDDQAHTWTINPEPPGHRLPLTLYHGYGTPHPHTFSSIGQQLVSWGDYQFALWYDRGTNGELVIGRIRRGVQEWGNYGAGRHDSWQVSGAPRWALDLPVYNDSHNYPSIAVDGSGRIHVWANMHGDPLRYIRTIASHETGDWLSESGWEDASGALTGFDPVTEIATYPQPTALPDGTLFFRMRDGFPPSRSGRSDSSFWTLGPDDTEWAPRQKIFQGLEVPGAGPGGTVGSGADVDDDTNWNAYPTNFMVEPDWCPHPGRLHVSWTWRPRAVINGGLVNGHEYSAYAHTDDKGASWHAIDGTELALPFTPLNTQAAYIDVLADQPLTNYGSLTLDPNGHPHMVLSWSLNQYYVRWDGSQWLRESLPNPVNGVERTAAMRGTCVWLRGDLWVLFVNVGAASGNLDRICLTNITSGHGEVVPLGGPVSHLVPDGAGGWGGGVGDIQFDPEAYRRYGTVEVLIPYRHNPRVFRYGDGSRFVASGP